MKKLTIAVLFVASALLTWIGVVSENHAAGVNWNRDNPERFDGSFDFLDMFVGFVWWGAEETSKGVSIFSNT